MSTLTGALKNPVIAGALLELLRRLGAMIAGWFRGRKQKAIVRKVNKDREKAPEMKQEVHDIGELIDQAMGTLSKPKWKYKHVKDFLVSLGFRITRHCIGSRVFPSVAIAQAALESAWGRKKDLTLFGIKGKGPAGSNILSTAEYINSKRVQIKDGFRAYRTYDEAIKDYIKLLHNPRYNKCLLAETAEKQIELIAKAGYATAPTYAKQIKAIIKDFNLGYFDSIKKKVEQYEA
jgi:flagellum-specific peptidoglycan hydrolase FlgJ